jgi:hypothetical protein
MSNRRVHGRYHDWNDYRQHHQLGTRYNPAPVELARAIRTLEHILAQCARPPRHCDTTRHLPDKDRTRS